MERHESFWIGTSDAPAFPALTDDVHVDVAIVGAGIVGTMAATFLKEGGRTVAVLEAGRVLRGVTGHTTAKVTALHTLVYDDLIGRFGQDKARLYAESNQAAIGIIEQLCRDRGLDCGLSETSAYTYTVKDDYVSKIEKEAAAAERLGLPSQYLDECRCRIRSRPPWVSPVSSSSTCASSCSRCCLRSPATAATSSSRRASWTSRRQARAVSSHRMAAARADHVVVATNSRSSTRACSSRAPSRGYALAMEVPQGRVPDGMFINVGAPTHSVRRAPHAGRTVLILAGEAHPFGEGGNHRQHWDRLEEWARNDLGATSVLDRWSVQDYYSLDRVPFIGRMSPGSDRLFTATGFSAWGMTNGVVAGHLLTDLIVETPNEWAELYDRNRINVAERSGTAPAMDRDSPPWARCSRDRPRPRWSRGSCSAVLAAFAVGPVPAVGVTGLTVLRLRAPRSMARRP